MPKRHMRLPNGFGQISEIKSKRLRKPFRVMITVGKTENGKPICKLLQPEAYFKTYNEAYTALLEYHKNPYKMDDLTMRELYEKWLEDEGHDGRTDGSLANLTTAWSYCQYLCDFKVNDVKVINIKECVDSAKITIKGEERVASPNRKKFMLMLLGSMFDYAIKYELTDKNPARQYKLPKAVTADANHVDNDHIAFTDDEMETLWENITDRTVKMILIQCYSGWRPSELLNLRIENVNITDWAFTGGMKTKAGINRTIPIHSKIRDLVMEFYDPEHEYLFEHDGSSYQYQTYHQKFQSTIKKLRLSQDHRPHDARKWFITTAKAHDVNEFAIKRIVGHSIQDITEKVYTERGLDWLRTEMEKIS